MSMIQTWGKRANTVCDLHALQIKSCIVLMHKYTVSCSLFMVQVPLRTKVFIVNRSLTRLGFKLITSRSWQYISMSLKTPALTTWPSVTYLFSPSITMLFIESATGQPLNTPLSWHSNTLYTRESLNQLTNSPPSNNKVSLHHIIGSPIKAFTSIWLPIWGESVYNEKAKVV